MKKLTAWLLAVAMVLGMFPAIALSTAAASDDMVTLVYNDFERISEKYFPSYISIEANPENQPTVELDTTTGANGSSRSAKITWNAYNEYNFVRARTEDYYILCKQFEEIANGLDSKMYFSFWAKADQPTTMVANLYIKESLFYPDGWVCNLDTEWQHYSFCVNDAVGQIDDDVKGMTIAQTIQQKMWGVGRQEAYLQGIRFDRGDGSWGATVWLDEIAFTGTEFSTGPDYEIFPGDWDDWNAFYLDPTNEKGATTTLMPERAFVDRGKTEGDYRYTVLDDGAAEIIGYTGTETKLTIPNKLGGYTVTGIGEQAFYRCSGLTDVTIPNSVIGIGDYAFSRCTSLTSVTIPDSVTSIDAGAFSGCTSLTFVAIPNSVTNIDRNAFFGCISLTNITIPNSVTSIGDYAFDNCISLTEVIIPNSVTGIGNYAFYRCSGLTDVTIPNSVISIGDRAFSGCINLTEVIIPNRVTSIGNWAFSYCTGLTNITIPNSVTSIGIGVFYDCTGLTSVIIPDSVSSIGGEAFGYATIGKGDDKMPNFKIYGYTGSAAETYANENDIPFIALPQLTDDSTGIVVQGTEDSLSAGTELKAELIATAEDEVSYNITLIKGGKEVQPNGSVTVKIPIPASMAGKIIKVYRTEEDGSRTNMNARKQGDYMVFTTDHFSEYILEAQAGIRGDIDGDGFVTPLDALAALRMSVGLDAPIDAADLDGDGAVTPLDALAVLRISVGLD